MESGSGIGAVREARGGEKKRDCKDPRTHSAEPVFHAVCTVYFHQCHHRCLRRHFRAGNLTDDSRAVVFLGMHNLTVEHLCLQLYTESSCTT